MDERRGREDGGRGGKRRKLDQNLGEERNGEKGGKQSVRRQHDEGRGESVTEDAQGTGDWGGGKQVNPKLTASEIIHFGVWWDACQENHDEFMQRQTIKYVPSCVIRDGVASACWAGVQVLDLQQGREFLQQKTKKPLIILLMAKLKSQCLQLYKWV